jgi:itaconyl-CoA hydratase
MPARPATPAAGGGHPGGQDGTRAHDPPTQEEPMTVHKAVLGRFFDDFEVGDIYQHPFGRTITETDNAWFTLLTCNTNQMHFNAHLSQQNPITDGKIIVVSGFTVGLVLGLSVIDMSQNAVANLGWNNIKLTHPVYVGDTIYAESLCTDKRPSKSRPDFGIISMETRALNQDGDVVMTYDRSVMVPTRASGIGQDYFPAAKAGPMQLPAQ